jgi:hypothetical protein
MLVGFVIKERNVTMIYLKMLLVLPTWIVMLILRAYSDEPDLRITLREWWEMSSPLNRMACTAVYIIITMLLIGILI